VYREPSFPHLGGRGISLFAIPCEPCRRKTVFYAMNRRSPRAERFSTRQRVDVLLCADHGHRPSGPMVLSTRRSGRTTVGVAPTKRIEL